MEKYHKYHTLLCTFFGILFISGILYSNSKILTKIIRLGDYPFRFSHFSHNENGDLIIDTEAYPTNSKRLFFGMKKDGREYFIDDIGNRNYHYSINMNDEKQRSEGESCFIKTKQIKSNMAPIEILLGISKEKAEFYDLKDLKNHHINSLYDLTQNLSNNIFSLIPDPLNTDDEFYYFFSYIAKTESQTYKLYTNKINFSISDDIIKLAYKEKMIEIDSLNQAMISCFFTSNYLYVCFYTKNDFRLSICVFDPMTKEYNEEYVYSFSSENYQRFYKGILLKDEIGFFAYFKDKGNLPYFSLYQINSDKTVERYKSYNEIVASKSYYIDDAMLNDLIKINENTICFAASYFDKSKINIVIFSFYSNYDFMNVKYYTINIYFENFSKIYGEIKLDVFNGFLLMAYSHCNYQIFGDIGYFPILYMSSLLFFSYPNSSEINFNIIDYILPNNKDINKDIMINFEEKLVIENNLFGYEFKGTKILNYSSNIILMKNGTIIKPEAIIEPGVNIHFKFKSEKIFKKGNYTIEYAFALTEPDYEIFEQNIGSIYEEYGNDKKSEKDFFKKNEYIGKASNFQGILSENLQSECKEKICSLCYSNNFKKCITCLNDFDYDAYTKIKTCHALPTDTEIKEKYTEAEINNEININIYTSNILLSTSDEVLLGTSDIKIANDKLYYIYNELRSQISPNISKIIQSENAIFQLSSLTQQKSNINPNISSVDLGECEKRLKNNSGLSENDDLIIFKVDIKNDNLSITYVQYEIYNPKTLLKMSLDICKDLLILINIPVNLDENTLTMYDSLTQSGYNLFDINDVFYNDICSTYTTENGTDLTLSDRKKIIYDNNGNITMCQKGCTFQTYNLTTKKSQCDCFVQTEETKTNLDEIVIENSNIKDEFFNTLNNSNFRVLKCFKLIFSIKGQKNNIGSYIMTGLSLIFIILFIVYIFKENYKINSIIKNIFQQKMDNISENKEKELKSESDIKIFNKSDETKTDKTKIKKSKVNNKNKSRYKTNKTKTETNKKNGNNKIQKVLIPPKRKPKKNCNESIAFKNTDDKINTKQSKTLDKIKYENNLVKLNSKKNKVKAFKQNQRIPSNIPINSNNKSNDDNILIKNIKDFMITYRIDELNDQEMNNLNYNNALILDKRTYFQYYISLLKKKQLILFAFYPNKDYNLTVAKISLLILSFSLYFTINGFFFSDATMNKINADHGKYDFLYQIPQMFYSTIISAIINFILKLLSLSEKKILSIRQEKNFSNGENALNSIIKCLKIKLALFFVFSFLFMSFFWYFISCFCAVYINTQKILIIDTLISFGLSMIYPFGINLIPGLFRIPALRAGEKNRKYLYIFSQYIALI